jgi:hypothetical protein
MPSLYSTLLVTEPDYGERVVRVHSGLHHNGASHTEGIDLVTGERVLMPISTRWDRDTQSDVRVSAEGWSWRPTPLAEAERRAGLPAGSLPPYGDSAKCDLWADQRMRDPAFIAMLTVLTSHPEIVFYEVDWRYWVHMKQPRERQHDDTSPLLTEPDQTSCMGAGRHTPYPLGGSGDMERYASQLGTLLSGASSPAVRQADEVYDTLSEAVLADLRHDYEVDVEWQRKPDAFRRLHTGPADMPVARTFAELQALAGWSPERLADLDDVHESSRERLVAETAAYRPQGVALSLF